MRLHSFSTSAPRYTAPKRQDVPQLTDPPVATEATKSGTKAQPKFGGFLNNLYNNLIAEPLAGYRKIEDNWGELRSPAGAPLGKRTPRQDRTNRTYSNFDFHNAGLKHVNFQHSKFQHGVDFKKSVCEIVNFSHCDMPGANFEGSVLNGSDFRGTRLTGANFSRCDLEDLTGGGPKQFWKNVENRHGGSPYASTQAAVADNDDRGWYTSSFETANLVGANFRNSDLRGVNFKHANMKEVDLGGADCRKADFTEADILGANISDTKLHGAKINIERVLKSGKEHGVSEARVIQEIGEILAAGGSPVGIETHEGAVKMLALNKAKQDGKITQRELTRAYVDAIGKSQSVPDSQAGIYVVKKVYEYFERQDIF